MLVAHWVIVGAWLSTTITCWVQVFWLPCTSVAVQTTKLVPTAYGALPLLTTVATAQLSPVVGVPSTTLVALHWPRSALTVTGAGQVMLGAWLSTTMTCWVQVFWLPCTSTTVQMTKFVPTGKLAAALLVTLAT